MPTTSNRRTAVHEMEHWFFGIYLPAWVELGAGGPGNDQVILEYWGFPLHAASVNMTRCLMTADDVISLLRANQTPLKEQGYTHTRVLDRRVVGFNENAGAIDVIWSRRRADQTEIERRAVHFEIHRTAAGWRVVAIASALTTSLTLDEVWETINQGDSA